MIIKALVEMPMGTKYKYEYDKDGRPMIDRVLNQRIPCNYGYIESTLAGDGDPLDIMIISEDPIPSMTRVQVELIGVFRCTDKGRQDDKLVGILVGTSGLSFVRELNAIKRYLKTYKEGFIIEEYYRSAQKAVDILNDSKEAFLHLGDYT